MEVDSHSTALVALIAFTEDRILPTVRNPGAVVDYTYRHVLDIRVDLDRDLRCLRIVVEYRIT